MVVVEHLPFNFGEKVGFVNYCQRALNMSACRILKTILTRILFYLYNKGKKDLINFFYGRFFIFSDIWSNH